MSDPQDTAPKTDPIRPTDDEARALARGILDQAHFAALGVIDPASQVPFVSRIAMATDMQGGPVTLISTLSAHSRALAENPACSLLIGEPGQTGDPLTHPRLTLQARVIAVKPGAADHGPLRDNYLGKRPKSKLYFDFGDFYFVRFQVTAGFLNGGFGRAFNLTPKDLSLPEG